jgi:hypothetical protein
MFSPSYGLVETPSKPEFEVEKAQMTFELNGEITEIPEIKFSIGGNNSKKYQKLGYNIKIKKGELYGRKQLRLRAFVIDPSFIRDKLGNDIVNALGLPSLSSNFAHLYINGRFMGLYSIKDAYKAHWIEANFGEKSTEHLYTCDYGKNPYFNCVNDDDKITDDTEYKEFMDRLTKSKTREELDQFFDSETYIRWQVVKYLFGSWDHHSNIHNIYLYKRKDGIWTQFLYDYDNSFGSLQGPNTKRTFYDEIVKYYKEPSPLIDVLQIYDNSTEFKKILEESLEKVFNPKKLFPHIDEIKEFLDPYIKEDRTPDANGQLPGRFPRALTYYEDKYSYDDFKDNTEYTRVKIRYRSSEEKILALKQWILERYLFACDAYKLNCASSIDYAKSIKYTVETVIHEHVFSGCKQTEYNCCVFSTTENVQTTEEGKWGVEFNKWCLIDDDFKNSNGSNTSNPSNDSKSTCWSEAYGYHCCKNPDTVLIEPRSKSNPGREWYGVEDNKWCGIAEYPEEKEKECWSSIFGYPCCQSKDTKPDKRHNYLNYRWYGHENGKRCGITDLQACPYNDKYKCCSHCNVSYTDSTKWGIENNHWCHIPSTCDLTV